MTPKTYADVCRMECEWCAKEIPRIEPTRGTPQAMHRFEYSITQDEDFPCTAPTPEALIERLLAEAAAIREELARLKGERASKLRFNSTPAPKKGEPGWLADEVL